MSQPSESSGALDEFREIFEKHNATTDEDSTRLMVLLRDKLYEMLRSPLKEEYTIEVFNWLAQLCMSSGDLSWISPQENWTEHEAKIFSCVARLSFGELHIIIPLIIRHLTCGDEPEVDEGKVMVRSANTEDYERFGNQLVIIECTIKTLVKRYDNETDENSLTKAMNPEELKSLLERLKETLSLIFDYLKYVHQNWDQLKERKDENPIKFEAAQGALRLMSVWLSEEPQTFDCDQFIIDLLVKNLMLLDGPSSDDLTITALHAVCTSDKKMFDKLHKLSDSRMVLDQYLKLAQNERNHNQGDRRNEKMFKLRLGLIKDLLEFYS